MPSIGEGWNGRLFSPRCILRPHFDPLAIHDGYHGRGIDILDGDIEKMAIDTYAHFHRIGPRCLNCRPRITACQGLTAAAAGIVCISIVRAACWRATTTAAAAARLRR